MDDIHTTMSKEDEDEVATAVMNLEYLLGRSSRDNPEDLEETTEESSLIYAGGQSPQEAIDDQNNDAIPYERSSRDNPEDLEETTEDSSLIYAGGQSPQEAIDDQNNDAIPFDSSLIYPDGQSPQEAIGDQNNYTLPFNSSLIYPDGQSPQEAIGDQNNYTLPFNSSLIYPDGQSPQEAIGDQNNYTLPFKSSLLDEMFGDNIQMAMEDYNELCVDIFPSINKEGTVQHTEDYAESGTSRCNEDVNVNEVTSVESNQESSENPAIPVTYGNKYVYGNYGDVNELATNTSSENSSPPVTYGCNEDVNVNEVTSVESNQESSENPAIPVTYGNKYVYGNYKDVNELATNTSSENSSPPVTYGCNEDVNVNEVTSVVSNQESSENPAIPVTYGNKYVYGNYGGVNELATNTSSENPAIPVTYGNSLIFKKVRRRGKKLPEQATVEHKEPNPQDQARPSTSKNSLISKKVQRRGKKLPEQATVEHKEPNPQDQARPGTSKNSLNFKEVLRQDKKLPEQATVDHNYPVPQNQALPGTSENSLISKKVRRQDKKLPEQATVDHNYPVPQNQALPGTSENSLISKKVRRRGKKLPEQATVEHKEPNPQDQALPGTSENSLIFKEVVRPDKILPEQATVEHNNPDPQNQALPGTSENSLIFKEVVKQDKILPEQTTGEHNNPDAQDQALRTSENSLIFKEVVKQDKILPEQTTGEHNNPDAQDQALRTSENSLIFKEVVKQDKILPEQTTGEHNNPDAQDQALRTSDSTFISANEDNQTPQEAAPNYPEVLENIFAEEGGLFDKSGSSLICESSLSYEQQNERIMGYYQASNQDHACQDTFRNSFIYEETLCQDKKLPEQAKTKRKGKKRKKKRSRNQALPDTSGKLLISGKIVRQKKKLAERTTAEHKDPDPHGPAVPVPSGNSFINEEELCQDQKLPEQASTKRTGKKKKKKRSRNQALPGTSGNLLISGKKRRQNKKLAEQSTAQHKDPDPNDPAVPVTSGKLYISTTIVKQNKKLTEQSTAEHKDPDPHDPYPHDPDPHDPDPHDPDPHDPEPLDPDPHDPEPLDPDPHDPEPLDPALPGTLGKLLITEKILGLNKKLKMQILTEQSTAEHKDPFSHKAVFLHHYGKYSISGKIVRHDKKLAEQSTAEHKNPDPHDPAVPVTSGGINADLQKVYEDYSEGGKNTAFAVFLLKGLLRHPTLNHVIFCNFMNEEFCKKNYFSINVSLNGEIKEKLNCPMDIKLLKQVDVVKMAPDCYRFILENKDSLMQNKHYKWFFEHKESLFYDILLDKADWDDVDSTRTEKWMIIKEIKHYSSKKITTAYYLLNSNIDDKIEIFCFKYTKDAVVKDTQKLQSEGFKEKTEIFLDYELDITKCGENRDDEVDEVSDKYIFDDTEEDTVRKLIRDKRSEFERREEARLNKEKEDQRQEARRNCEKEIQDLESKPHLSPEQKDRLQALKLKQEIQRQEEQLYREENGDSDELHKQRPEETRPISAGEIQELESRSSFSSQQEDRLPTLRLEEGFQRGAEDFHSKEDEAANEMIVEEDDPLRNGKMEKRNLEHIDDEVNNDHDHTEKEKSLDKQIEEIIRLIKNLPGERSSTEIDMLAFEKYLLIGKEKSHKPIAVLDEIPKRQIEECDAIALLDETEYQKVLAKMGYNYDPAARQVLEEIVDRVVYRIKGSSIINGASTSAGNNVDEEDHPNLESPTNQKEHTPVTAEMLAKKTQEEEEEEMRRRAKMLAKTERREALGFYREFLAEHWNFHLEKEKQRVEEEWQRKKREEKQRTKRKFLKAWDDDLEEESAELMKRKNLHPFQLSKRIVRLK